MGGCIFLFIRPSGLGFVSSKLTEKAGEPVSDQMVIWGYLEALSVRYLIFQRWQKKSRRLTNPFFSLPGRKMKPLLPRINSYLVPIQFPVSQPLVLQPSMKVPLSMAQGASLNSSETFQCNKRVRIAPKVVFNSCFWGGGMEWGVLHFVFSIAAVFHELCYLHGSFVYLYWVLQACKFMARNQPVVIIAVLFCLQGQC